MLCGLLFIGQPENISQLHNWNKIRIILHIFCVEYVSTVLAIPWCWCISQLVKNPFLFFHASLLLLMRYSILMRALAAGLSPFRLSKTQGALSGSILKQESSCLSVTMGCFGRVSGLNRKSSLRIIAPLLSHQKPGSSLFGYRMWANHWVLVLKIPIGRQIQSLFSA